MFDFGWLNVGSIVLGLIAWILPAVSFMKWKRSNHRNKILFSMVSMSACAVAVCMQIFYTSHLVEIEDWSALMDTTDTVAWVSALLIGTTILINTIVLTLSCSGKSRKIKR